MNGPVDHSEKAAKIRAQAKNRKKHFNSVIIVAAGKGTRMGRNLQKTKQMTDVCGIPVVVRSISQFEYCSFVNEIIVVAGEEELGLYDALIEQYGFKKITAVTKGGPTRQLSVLEGFRRISSRAEYVAIHDGARCLVTPAMIESVFTQAFKYGSAAAAQQVKDTVKKTDNSGFITETVDRTCLWNVQTPQIFKTDIYRASAYIAQKNGLEATDDCMLVENIGFKIKLVDCGYENIKITTPDDLYLAEAVLRFRADRERENNHD